MRGCRSLSGVLPGGGERGGTWGLSWCSFCNKAVEIGISSWNGEWAHTPS